MKFCKCCQELKPLSEFSPNRKTYRPECKVCHRDKSRLSVLKRELTAEPLIDSNKLVADLALKYKKNNLWIARGLKACELANVDISYFIRRYLDREISISKNAEVERIFKELTNERKYNMR